MMRYLSHSSRDVRAMLEDLGLQSVEELFAPIPAQARLKEPLDLPPARSEPEILERFRALARKNRVPPEIHLYVGAGAYRHFIPAVVWDVISKPEFATAYTPYQPEISQGTLQSIFEFQTLVCQLTGMDVANASMYDGATAFAEAVLMARRIHRRRKRHVLVARTVHPEYRRVLQTYVKHLDMEVEEIPYHPETGALDREALARMVRDDTFAVAVQSPNFFGVIEDQTAVAAVLQDHPAVKIAVFTEALSLGLLRPPGEAGFDIVAGEGQSWGVPPSFGGPHLGVMATRTAHVRRMPGRIVGMARDHEGRRGFVLTLSAREQHIRREKATSNICTNQALCALAATVYLSLLGPRGLRRLAEINTRRAHFLRERLGSGPSAPAFTGPFFNEFVLKGPDVIRRREDLLARNFLVGVPLSTWYPELPDHLLVTVTEMNSPASMQRLVELWRAVDESGVARPG